MVMNASALVRKHYPDLVLAADANRSYSYQEIDKVRQYDDLGLACIEEPFACKTFNLIKDWKWGDVLIMVIGKSIRQFVWMSPF